MDFKQIQIIIKEFEKSSMTFLEIENEGFKIKLSKNKGEKVEVITSDKTEEIIEPKSVGFEVKSPLVGTFYAASNPNEKPFVSVGERVEVGDTLCIIEAMKIMNEITAPVSGVIDSIKITNGSPVGFDQVIMVIV